MSDNVDCQAFMNRVLGAEKGSAAGFSTKGGAINFRQRCYQFTIKQRKLNKKIYSDDPNHPMYGASAYDRISMRIVEEGGKWWVQGYATAEAAEANMEIKDL